MLARRIVPVPPHVLKAGRRSVCQLKKARSCCTLVTGMTGTTRSNRAAWATANAEITIPETDVARLAPMALPGPARLGPTLSAGLRELLDLVAPVPHE